MTAFVRFHDLSKSYYEGDVRRVVLQNAHAEFQPGEMTVILGKSGSGKSTLLNLISGIDEADSGQIWVDGQELTSLPERDRTLFRRARIGFVFQFHHLLPEFTALENVCIPAFIAGMARKDAEKRAMELFRLMNLSDRTSHKPSALSGGEQQRVAVARSLVNNPRIVLADEPSGNLDSNAARELHQLFFSLRDQIGQTFVIVTHNLELAKMADRIISIKDGRIE